MNQKPSRPELPETIVRMIRMGVFFRSGPRFIINARSDGRINVECEDVNEWGEVSHEDDKKA